MRTRDLYSRYQQLTEKIGTKQVVERRVRAHLSDLDMLGLANAYERNEGKRSGRYKEYEMDVSLATVLDILGEEKRFVDAADQIRRSAHRNGHLD